MSGSNCCFLTYIQVSPEAVRWSGIPISLRIFHSSLWSTVKCFSVVNETVDVFLEFSIFFYDPTDISSLISGSSAFSKSSLYIWKFSVHILLKPGLKDFKYNLLLACQMSAIVQWFEHSLALPFFGIGMKTNLFQSYGHCWVFQICWHIECSTLTASSFRIWDSSAGIPSPPLVFKWLSFKFQFMS